MRLLRLSGADPTATPDPVGDGAAIAEAAAVLRTRGLVAFPTETVYGLGAIARSPEAVARIFAAKGRPADDPLIVHVLPDWPLDTVVAAVSPVFAALAAAHWPGPLTLVAPKHPSIPGIVTADGPTVAVRAPAHPVAAALLAAVGEPVAAPSANRFSYVSATTAQHVVDDLGDAVDVVLDGGPATAGIESTVVAVEPGDDGERLVVLRHGALAVEDLTVELGIGVDVVDPDPDTRLAQSPGRLVRHYSPGTTTLACPAGATPPSDLPGRVCHLACDDDRAAVPGRWERRDLGSVAALDAVARDLYATLRAVDREGFDTIVVQLTGRGGLGAAIDDRLRRAASGRLLA